MTPDDPSRTTPRRSFLKGTAAVAAASLAAPRLLAAAEPPAAANAKVNLACVGIGNRGAEVIKALHATGQANLVAFCDTDMGAKQTRPILEQFPKVPQFQDFRTMFDKMGSGIDAICVGTPDHSHFPVTMLAMSLGKHVYVEKPLAHSYHEVDLLMQAEKKYRVAAQMGNQGHSEANYFQFKTWVEAGIIKNVTRITAFMNGPRRWHGKRFYDYLNEEPAPASLDWDGWLTSAQFRPYNTGYANGEWRSWFAFGNGALGDWGAHIVDTAHEFLDLGLPAEVDPVKLEGHSDFIFPQASTIAFRFPARGAKPPVELTWYDGRNNPPPLPDDMGEPVVDPNIPPPSKGQINTTNYPPGKVIYGEGLTFKGGTHGSTLEIIPKAKAAELAATLPEVPASPSNHYLNFLRACRGEEVCRSNFAVSGPLCQMMALGIIAQRLNRKIEFDRQTGQITNDKLANELLTGPPPRKGWESFYRL